MEHVSIFEEIAIKKNEDKIKKNMKDRKKAVDKTNP